MNEFPVQERVRMEGVSSNLPVFFFFHLSDKDKFKFFILRLDEKPRGSVLSTRLQSSPVLLRVPQHGFTRNITGLFCCTFCGARMFFFSLENFDHAPSV
jgi:hypothetical protein